MLNTKAGSPCDAPPAAQAAGHTTVSQRPRPAGSSPRPSCLVWARTAAALQTPARTAWPAAAGSCLPHLAKHVVSGLLTGRMRQGHRTCAVRRWCSCPRPCAPRLVRKRTCQAGRRRCTRRHACRRQTVRQRSSPPHLAQEAVMAEQTALCRQHSALDMRWKAEQTGQVWNCPDKKASCRCRASLDARHRMLVLDIHCLHMRPNTSSGLAWPWPRGRHQRCGRAADMMDDALPCNVCV